MTRISPWRPLASAVVVAIGLSVAWGFLAVWASAVLSTSYIGVSESLVVATDGRPLIETRSPANWQDVSFFTLDRRPVDIPGYALLAGASFSAPYTPPRLFDETLDWSERIGGLANASKPAALWYVIRSAERPGAAYLAGYDPVTKRVFAYASKQGVRPDPPEEADWFQVGDESFGWGRVGALASAGFFQRGGYAGQYYSAFGANESIKPWNLYLIDGEDLIEVNLRKKATKKVATIPGLRMVALISAPAKWAEPTPNNTDARQLPLRTPEGKLRVTPAQIVYAPDAITLVEPAKVKTRNQLAVIGEASVAVVDPELPLIRSFKLPEPLRQEGIIVYSVAVDQLLIVSSEKKDQVPTGMLHLTWIDPDGGVVNKQTAKLASLTSMPTWREALLVAGMVPSALMWALAWFAGGPVAALQLNQATSYAAALEKTTEMLGPAAIAVFVLGAVLAVVVWRKHRALYRHHAGLWAAFVLLMGPAGLVAYWLHWRRPVMEACPNCGQNVPRDRESCAACGADWNPPDVLGVEVYG